MLSLVIGDLFFVFLSNNTIYLLDHKKKQSRINWTTIFIMDLALMIFHNKNNFNNKKRCHLQIGLLSSH